MLAQEGRNLHREVLVSLGDACWLFLKQDLHEEGEADKGLFSGCATSGAGAEEREARGARRAVLGCNIGGLRGSIALHHAADLASGCRPFMGNGWTTTTAKWKGCPNQLGLLEASRIGLGGSPTPWTL